MIVMRKMFGASIVCVLLAACGSSSTTQTTTTTSTTVVNTTTIPQSDAEPLLIEITVGEDSSPDRIELVELGTPVEIVLVNPDAEDEYHLHGYDITSKKMNPGMPATLSFTASQAGTFELESHITNDVLVVLEVS